MSKSFYRYDKKTGKMVKVSKLPAQKKLRDVFKKVQG